MRPSASTRPGFSAPGAPWRQSFMGLSSVRIGTVEGNVAVELDAEARPVEFAGADAAVHRHRLAEQLRCEHRHHLGRAGVHHQKFGAGRVMAGYHEMIAVPRRDVRHHTNTLAFGLLCGLYEFGD